MAQAPHSCSLDCKLCLVSHICSAWIKLLMSLELLTFASDPLSHLDTGITTNLLFAEPAGTHVESGSVDIVRCTLTSNMKTASTDSRPLAAINFLTIW